MKKITALRYISYWLYVLATIGIPIGLIAWQFDLFKKPGAIQITGYGIIAIIITVFIMRGHIKRAIADLDKGILRTVLQNLTHLTPYIVFWFVVTFLEDYIIKLRFVLLCAIIGQTLAIFLDIWHTILLKKCKKE